jgi:hypothetical protein
MTQFDGLTNPLPGLRIPAGLVLLDEIPGHGAGACRVCGCTDRQSCISACAWETEDRDLCTACAERVLAITAPSRRDAVLVEHAIAHEHSHNVLTLALQLGTGDWRRSFIRTRLARLGLTPDFPDHFARGVEDE